jgi:hypothetical protein
MIREVGIVWTSDAHDCGGDRSVIGFYAILRPTVCLFRLDGRLFGIPPSIHSNWIQ